MTPQEFETLADLVVKKLIQHKRDFWVEPEAHYQDHLSLREMVTEWRRIKGMFWQAFIGFAIIGTLVLSALGIFFSTFGLGGGTK